MQRRPTRFERRVIAWIDQTNASSLENDPSNVQEWLERSKEPSACVVSPPLPTRQRRRAMTATDRRPSSHSSGNASLSCPKSPTSSSAEASSTVQHTTHAVRSDSGSGVIDPSNANGADGGLRRSPGYSALAVLGACFLCAALLPSLFALLVFAIFLTFAPSWSLIQVRLPRGNYLRSRSW